MPSNNNFSHWSFIEFPNKGKFVICLIHHYTHNSYRQSLLTTGSSRKSVKSKFVCTGINFHKKWILWGVLGSEIATNLSSTSTRSVFRFTGCIALWTARTTRWTRPGKRLTWPPARFFQNLQKWSKSVQKCPRVIQIHISSIFDRYPSFGSVLGRFGHFWKKRAKGHVSLLPGLVLLVVLAVHSALACHSVFRTISNRYCWNRHTRTL